jgi:hypothetical protein
MHRTAFALAVVGLFALNPAARAQSGTPAKSSAPPATPKSGPAKIEPQFYVVGDPVVLTEWPHTLGLVNAPHSIALMNPGQCVRVGILATGDDRDDFLKNTKVSFTVTFSGKSDAHSLSAMTQFKRIKPAGWDAATDALAASGSKQSNPTFASMGVSADHWCVPNDAADGTATVAAETESPAGHQSLTPATVRIQSFDTGSKKVIAGEQEFGDFFKTYYRQPNPARLLPILQFAVADDAQSPSAALLLEVATFLSAALKTDPVAAADFMKRVATQPDTERRLGLIALRSAGYDISSVVKTLKPEEQDEFSKMPAPPDPYDLAPTRELPLHIDMLWGVFGATGGYDPVKTVASGLGWRSDYDQFVKWRDTPDHSKEITPWILHGVGYMAAGFSLASFKASDPLVSDYIDFMLASPDIPITVKAELATMGKNSAFKRDAGQ